MKSWGIGPWRNDTDREESDVFIGNPLPVPVSPSEIPHGLDWD
jgi:hypothetical protein